MPEPISLAKAKLANWVSALPNGVGFAAHVLPARMSAKAHNHVAVSARTVSSEAHLSDREPRPYRVTPASRQRRASDSRSRAGRAR